MEWSKEELAPQEVVMRDLLVRQGFSPERVEIRVAWEAFKEFASASIPMMPEYCAGYACFHESDRDDVLWVEFVRQTESGLRCGCVLSTVVPKELRGVSESWWWWPEHGTLDDWVARVEWMRGFNACMKHLEWKWEGFSS